MQCTLYNVHCTLYIVKPWYPSQTVQQGKLGEALEAQVTGVAIEVPEIPPKVPGMLLF